MIYEGEALRKTFEHLNTKDLDRLICEHLGLEIADKLKNMLNDEYIKAHFGQYVKVNNTNYREVAKKNCRRTFLLYINLILQWLTKISIANSRSLNLYVL
ncbi:hypothetical protein BIY23_01700 [Wolbachia pipientis]|uniref:Uncharacterized protein n=1 Tax=Wolbachia pipientis TaxID=955 RepID=A0A1E7QL15_WOLPI|nr:hypothetical protein BIY23_01700 [Wolbachia pipientis]